MRSLLLAAGLAAAAAWGIVRHLPEGEAQAEPRAVRAQQIQSVAIDGARDLPVTSLREVLASHAGDQLDTAKLEHDRAALQDALAQRGNLAAKVGAAQVTFDEQGAAYVMFAIDPGPEFHVRKVEVVGATAKDAGVVTLTAGEVASPARFAQAREALSERLAARGKKATVTVQVTTDEAAAAVDVVLSASR
jgi:outer membrane protein assembly factor BamA